MGFSPRQSDENSSLQNAFASVLNGMISSRLVKETTPLSFSVWSYLFFSMAFFHAVQIRSGLEENLRRRNEISFYAGFATVSALIGYISDEK